MPRDSSRRGISSHHAAGAREHVRRRRWPWGKWSGAGRALCWPNRTRNLTFEECLFYASCMKYEFLTRSYLELMSLASSELAPAMAMALPLRNCHCHGIGINATELSCCRLGRHRAMARARPVAATRVRAAE